MKKILNILLVLFVLTCFGITAEAMTFEEGLQASHQKPMLMLVYAQWADNCDTYLQNFRNLKNTYGDKFNYVELDIASPDTKAFNERCHIYPNLPYVLMYKNGGTITRYIQRSYVADYSTMVSKINLFVH